MQNLRAYLILYFFTIKWIMCVQEKIELSSMSQGARLNSTKILGNLSIAIKVKQQ